MIFEWTIRILSTEVLIIGAGVVIALWLFWLWCAKRDRRDVFVFTQYEMVILIMPVVAWFFFDIVALLTDPLITVPLVAVSRWARAYVIVSHGYIVTQKLRHRRHG